MVGVQIVSVNLLLWHTARRMGVSLIITLDAGAVDRGVWSVGCGRGFDREQDWTSRVGSQCHVL